MRLHTPIIVSEPRRLLKVRHSIDVSALFGIFQREIDMRTGR